LQDIREYELDYEAAKKAAAAVAIEAEKEEERRIKMLEKNPLGELPGFEEEEDFNFGAMLAVLSLWVNGLLDLAASINDCRNIGMHLHACCLLGPQRKNTHYLCQLRSTLSKTSQLLRTLFHQIQYHILCTQIRPTLPCSLIMLILVLIEHLQEQ